MAPPRSSSTSSRYIGVHAHKGKWVATISSDGTNQRLGTFASPKAAARAYDKAARKLGRPVNRPRRGERQAVRGVLPTKGRFKGVSRDKWSGRWRAQIHHDGRSKHLGSFATEEEAANAWDVAAAAHGRTDLNHASDPPAGAQQLTPQQQAGGGGGSAAGPASSYVGVTQDQGVWVARITIPGTAKQQRLGRFESELAAAEAHDAKARELVGHEIPVNFPRHGYAETQAVKGRQRTTGRYVGVSFNKRSSKWVAKIYHDGHKQQLGTFATADEAAKAWDEAATGYGRTDLNFPRAPAAAAAAVAIKTEH